MSRWLFDYCRACAENDEGAERHDPGVGCPSDGPADGCEAVWIDTQEPSPSTPHGERDAER